MQTCNSKIPSSIMALTFALALSGCAATGGPGGTGTGGTTSAEPEVFQSHFSRLTKFGNFDVSNPRLAEGGPDGEYAVVETHGALTLDIGSGLSFYDGTGEDIHVETDPDREATYTVHVSHASSGDEQWTEIGRGYGGSGAFDFHGHTDGPADFLQIRNEGTSPLYLDGATARYVRHD